MLTCGVNLRLPSPLCLTLHLILESSFAKALHKNLRLQRLGTCARLTPPLA